MICNCYFISPSAVVEDDPTTGRYYVGRGCYPNAEGVVQLDAAIMRGSDCSIGGVAALERYTSLAVTLCDIPNLRKFLSLLNYL